MSGEAALKIAATLALGAALAGLAGSAAARDISKDGLTVQDVVAWLQDKGMKADVKTADDGTKYVDTALDGVGFQVYQYDCNGDRCGSLQFAAGFTTKGAWGPGTLNDWNRANRWGRAYSDKVNDPWVEMDCDLTPGGTWEELDDEFATWRTTFRHFRDYIHW